MSRVSFSRNTGRKFALQISLGILDFNMKVKTRKSTEEDAEKQPHKLDRDHHFVYRGWHCGVVGEAASFNIGIPVQMPAQVSAALLPSQLPANVSWKEEEEWSKYFAHATHTGNLARVPETWSRPGHNTAVPDIWGMNQLMEVL